MPFIEVKVFENELNQQQATQIIEGITNVITDVTSEKLKDVTWVVINEVKSGHWGVSGTALGLDDVKRIIAGD